MSIYMQAALDDAEWNLAPLTQEARQFDGRGASLYVKVMNEGHDECLEVYMSRAMSVYGISARAAKLLFDVNTIRAKPRHLSVRWGGVTYANISTSIGCISAAISRGRESWTFRGDSRGLMSVAIDKLMKDLNPDLLRPKHKIEWSRRL